MTQREKLIKEISDTCRYKHDDAVSPYKVADFIIADRKAVLERVMRPLTEYCKGSGISVSLAIKEALSEIDRAIDKPIS